MWRWKLLVHCAGPCFEDLGIRMGGGGHVLIGTHGGRRDRKAGGSIFSGSIDEGACVSLPDVKAISPGITVNDICFGFSVFSIS